MGALQLLHHLLRRSATLLKYDVATLAALGEDLKIPSCAAGEGNPIQPGDKPTQYILTKHAVRRVLGKSVMFWTRC